MKITPSENFIKFLFLMKNGNIKDIEFFIKNKNTDDVEKLLNSTDEDGDGLIILAIMYNLIEIVEFLIKLGMNINQRGFYGATALMLTAKTPYTLPTLKLLIDKKADVNCVNDDGFSALMYASSLGNVEAVRLLIDAGANINHQDRWGYTALMRSIESVSYALHPNINCVRFLIQAGSDINIEGSPFLINFKNQEMKNIIFEEIAKFKKTILQNELKDIYEEKLTGFIRKM